MTEDSNKDREADGVNSPGRPIPSGRVRPREAHLEEQGLGREVVGADPNCICGVMRNSVF